GLPLDITRLVWVGGSLALAIWTLRRIGLPGYWLAFPPLFQAIQLGHPEVLVLWLLVSGGVASGLAAVIKPYAGFALLAELFWAVPIPGATLAGLLAEVALLQAARRWHLPAWLESGTQPAGLARAPESPVPLSEPARLAARA